MSVSGIRIAYVSPVARTNPTVPQQEDLDNCIVTVHILAQCKIASKRCDTA
jgi:hypothetical protein